MNLLHHWLCQSAAWKKLVERELVPWALDGMPLGRAVLEIGPGFGATTEVLCRKAKHLTCVEIDPRLAESLRLRLPHSGVTVLCEDATAMSLPSSRFDTVVCFTMLHHVPSRALQDRLLSEVARVLRPGGVFAGTDSISSWLFRLFHLFDPIAAVDPDSFERRLVAAGFTDITVEIDPRARSFRFQARKPPANWGD